MHSPRIALNMNSMYLISLLPRNRERSGKWLCGCYIATLWGIEASLLQLVVNISFSFYFVFHSFYCFYLVCICIGRHFSISLICDDYIILSHWRGCSSFPSAEMQFDAMQMHTINIYILHRHTHTHIPVTFQTN